MAHRLCMKQQLNSFHIVDNISFVYNLTKFQKIIDYSKNIKVKLEDKDKDIFISSLSRSFELNKSTTQEYNDT